jgi:putative ABC transport system permease protein
MLNPRFELGPIFRTLMRNKVGAILIASQIAVTMSIVVNAVSIIAQRTHLISSKSGVDEANSFFLTSSGFAADFNKRSSIEKDLNDLRRLPGVVDAILLNALPINGFGTYAGVQTKLGQGQEVVNAGVYIADHHALNAFDVTLIGGENFAATDLIWNNETQSAWPGKVIITKAMAEASFPDHDWQYALGKTLYVEDDQGIIVTGIIDKLQGSWVNWSGSERTMISPQHKLSGPTYYYIRTEPGLRDPMMLQIEEMLSKNTQRIILDMQTMTQTRAKSYSRDSAMVKILTTVISVLTLVTAFGIIGLASFNVNRRTKQIGTKRALGASKSDIMRYFMLENLIISLIGVSLGVVLSIGLNMLLVQQFSLARIQGYLIPLAMLALCVIGQLAVLWPAKRAASIAPAVATRSV